LERFKKAGIKQVVIDPYFNDTAALYGNEWIPIRPETDEALMSAIAHVWIEENCINREFLASHSVGFEEFRDYVLGKPDGVPKTPRWAAGICGASEPKIRELAREWASRPTYILCDYGGANRRHAAAEWSRMIVTLQALLGNIGQPGRGLGPLKFSTQGQGQKGIPDLFPPESSTPSQTIRHAQFPDAILNPPISWTTIDSSGCIAEKRYPLEGKSRIRLVAFMSGSGWFLNQIPGTPSHVRAMQSPEIEFAYCHAAWWHAAPKFSDVILPIRHIGERDDIVNWENYTVYSHAVVEPEGEPWNDLDILSKLAERLGFGSDFTMGKGTDDWLRQIHSNLELPLSYEAFKEKGYHRFPVPDEPPQVGATFADFNGDPEANRLATPSGKIEIRSSRMADFFGKQHEQAPVVPKYIPSPESEGRHVSKYPLILTSPHSKMGRHSQWRNLSWHRDEHQVSRDGRSVLMISGADAAARDIQTGQAVRICNDRGAIICTARVTERLMPGVVRVDEGGWYTPCTPGEADSIDIGGNPNVLISRRQPEPLSDGMIATTRVEVTREED
jgi:molybdopterin guanine dinucleotide-containing S/N-oxide reductase-like protein